MFRPFLLAVRTHDYPPCSEYLTSSECKPYLIRVLPLGGEGGGFLFLPSLRTLLANIPGPIFASNLGDLQSLCHLRWPVNTRVERFPIM
jgi:hypothetical protein